MIFLPVTVSLGYIIHNDNELFYFIFSVGIQKAPKAAWDNSDISFETRKEFKTFIQIEINIREWFHG